MANSLKENSIVTFAAALLTAGLVLVVSALGELWVKPAVYLLFGGILFLLGIGVLYQKMRIRTLLFMAFVLIVIIAIIVCVLFLTRPLS